ncbi:cytochrome P450 [Nocardiopsis mangrovi]|uniref:Cytochrome P450 n=1 Tax=Nocardiopsis mangrovi TaxID=1179818 RepID=A0ABV9E488_9ACTN
MTERDDGAPPACPWHADAVPLYETVSEPDRRRVWEPLRSRFGQVAPVLLEPDLPAWLLLGYEENLEVLRDWGTFSRDTRRWNEIRDGRRKLDEGLRPAMGYRKSAIYCDGAEHARLAAPISDALSRLTDTRIRTDITEAADTLIDDFCAEGSADLVADYADLLPALLMNRFFGLEDIYGYVLGELSGIIWTADGARGADAVVQLRNYFGGLVLQKRAVPGSDLTSWMMEHPVGLTDREMADQLVLLSAAAQEPTANLLGNVLRELLVDPDVAREYASGGLLLDDIVNHVIWTEPPMQALCARFPTRDVTIDGTRIAEGEPLIIGFAPAHHDPRLRDARDDTGSPLPSGHNSAHLTWGAGEHRCPAQSLALQVVALGIEHLLDRLSGVRLAVDPGDLRWRRELLSRGLTSLPIEFTPVPPPARPAPAPPAARPADGGEPVPQTNDLLHRVMRWWQGSGRRRRR